MTHQYPRVSKIPDSLLFVCLLGVAVLCYATTIPNYFQCDDFDFIGSIIRNSQNHHHSVSLNPSFFFSFWQGSEFLRPGVLFSFWIDYSLWGINPIGYHLTNILAHAVSACALYRLGTALLPLFGVAATKKIGLGAACLFVALPSHSESVAWISGRSDVLATAFGLIATVFFVQVLTTVSIALAGSAFVFLLAALFTKESVVVLPTIWAVIWGGVWLHSRSKPNTLSLLTLAGSGVCVGIVFLTRSFVLGPFAGASRISTLLAACYDLSVLSNLLRYLARTFLPPLPAPVAQLLSHPFFWVGLVGVVIFVVSSRIASRQSYDRSKARLYGVLSAAYLLSLVPVLTISVSLIDTQNERFLYLASAFACLLFVAMLFSIITSQRLANTFLLVVILVELALLQMVNTRWTVAATLAQQIASEVAQTSPHTTLVLNVPDNFRGAYIFRNGLHSAATWFLQNPQTTPYKIITTHNLTCLTQTVYTTVEDSALHITLPEGLQFYSFHTRHQSTLPVSLNLHHQTMTVTFDQNALPEISSVLSFQNGSISPMLLPIPRPACETKKN